MSDIAAPAGGRTAASSEEALERSDRRDGGRREPERIGLYPPQRSGRSTRMIGEVVVDLGLADKKTVEDIDDDAAEEEGDPLALDEAEGDAPIIKLVHSIVAQAIHRGASDIHVNPEEGDWRVVFRVDGVLTQAATIKRKMAKGEVSR